MPGGDRGINTETLSCVGYDHNWVRGYEYANGYEPLLPKGTILHIVGYMDNSAANRNVPDPRNWSGAGNRSVSNMFIDLGHGVAMTDEQFAEEMADGWVAGWTDDWLGAAAHGGHACHPARRE